MSEVHYSAPEERLNILTHGFGMIASLLALVVMLHKSDTTSQITSSLVFGLSLLLLFSASTFYHAAKEKKLRARLRIFDHAAIYVLIAGTYTPVCLITLDNSIGQTLLIVIWSVAIGGVVVKLFFTGKYDKLSTFMYIAMGWIAIFAIKPLLVSMSADGLLWLLAGGIFYTMGAILYSIKSIPMNHAIFHVFVLGGSISHFLMVFLHIL